MKLTLLVLAAGMGSRYGGLKQVDAFGPDGEKLLEYSVFDAVRAGFDEVVFVIRKEMEAEFRAGVGRRFERQVAVNYVFQELDAVPAGWSMPAGRTKPWGTTHAILVAAGAVRGPFAVINADDFYGREAYQLLAAHLAGGSPDYAMVGFTLQNTLSDFGSVARGVCRVGPDGLLQSVEELTRIEREGAEARNTDAKGRVTILTGREVVSMNCWGFTPAIFGQLQAHFEAFLRARGGDLKAECYLPSAVNDLVAAGRAKVRVLRTAGSWFGVTYQEDRPRVVQQLRELTRAGVYPETLWHETQA